MIIGDLFQSMQSLSTETDWMAERAVLFGPAGLTPSGPPPLGGGVLPRKIALGRRTRMIDPTRVRIPKKQIVQIPWIILGMAERAGFEPAWGGKAPNRFRVGAGMATSVPLPEGVIG